MLTIRVLTHVRVRSKFSSWSIRSISSVSSDKLDTTVRDVLDPNGKCRKSIQPTSPARTRFAPSPTGYLHLGSLRTALYNYLLAKSTGGQFILRLEDTDQSRVVEGAESDIYNILKWCAIVPDEGPQEGGSYGPYRQSDRKSIYQKYADMLIQSGHAYKCYCSKERLNDLRESAIKLKPPTTVTYDRHCLGTNHATNEHSPIIRFKSPDRYKPVQDLTHGILDLQPQYNYSDKRFDDFVIMKSDGLPTYHFANIVDDHLMGITHVIRGEEWLTSTPKHVALYEAFGWTPPKFVHIPLLTSLKDKKLSKRSGDIGISSLRAKGILPEALINFTALFGWSPSRKEGATYSEVMTLNDLINNFTLDNLTKGNAKVDMAKLKFFNKSHLHKKFQDPKCTQEILDQLYTEFKPKYNVSRQFFEKAVCSISASISNLQEIDQHNYLFQDINFTNIKSKIPSNCLQILKLYSQASGSYEAKIKSLLENHPEFKKKEVYQALRYAYTGGASGLTIPLILEIMDPKLIEERLHKAIKSLS